MEPEPSAARLLEMLQDRSRREDGPFPDGVANFFSSARFPDRRPEIEAEYERCLRQEASSVDEHGLARRGALGFYLFCSFAERWGTTNDDADRQRADEYLRDERVRSYVFDLYDMEDTFRDRDLVLHASGTTSFIIKAHYLQNAYHRVVKIIKPWHLADPVIAAQTKGAKTFYDDRLAHVTFRPPKGDARPIAPNVEHAGRHCIIMKFVEGETLKQYFNRLWAEPEVTRAVAREDPYVALNQLLQSLCGMMKACHQAGIAHGDLSSTNILIERLDGDFPHLRLIDFGINYLLTRNLDYGDKASAQIASIDPDVMKRKRDAVPTLESDMYSLGVIMTEGLLGERYRAGGIQVILDDVYDNHPGVGAILDDLLDAVPARRLPGVPPGVDPYDFVAARIDFELRAVSSLDEIKSHGLVKILQNVIGIIFPGLPDIIEVGAQRVQGRGGPPTLPPPEPRPRLDLSQIRHVDLVVPGAFNVLIASIVLGRIMVWDPFVQGENPFTDSMRDSWLAWVVVLACSIIASRYSRSIFAGLLKSELPRTLAVSTTLCTFAPWIPLLLIVFRYPDEWLPLVAAAGTVVVANNVLWYRFCNRIVRNKALGIHVSPLMTETVASLRGWRETSVITLICVYVVAILAARDVLHDVTFYALLIAVVIAPRVYFSNLRTDAPGIRTGLQRFSNGYRRSQVASERGEQQVPLLRERSA